MNNRNSANEKQQYQILQELEVAGKFLRVASSQKEVLAFTIQTLRKLGFERIRIWLMDDEKKEFYGGKCSYVPDKKFQKIRGDLRFKKSSPYMAHALTKKEPFVDCDNLLLKNFLNDYSTKKTIEFPLIVGKRTLGSIGVDNEISNRPIILKKLGNGIMPFVNQIAFTLYRIITDEKIKKVNLYLKNKISEATSELKKRNTELEYLANHDNLSGLPNRRYFDRKLTKVFNNATTKKLLTLAMLDLDFLKHVNDTKGHEAGDRLITKVGEILQKDKNIDFAARFAGDEFIFLMTNKSHKIHKKIFSAILKKIKKGTRQTASIGAVTYPNREIKSEIDLVRLADDALYHAKHTGRNRHVCALDEEEQIIPLTERRLDLQEIEERGTFAIDYIRQLRAINKISEHLRKNTSEEIIVQKIVKSFHDDLDFKRVGIYLEETKSGEMTLAAHSNINKLLVNKITPIIKAPKLDFWIRKVTRMRKVANLDEKEIPTIFKKPFGTHRMLVIPLIGRTIVLGVIIAEYEPTRIIRKSDLDFYLTLGDQIETGIIKLRALKETRDFNKKLKREVTVATQKLQKYSRSLEEQVEDNRELLERNQRINFELISALVTSLEEKDIYTRGHSVRVSSYAVKLGKRVGMNKNRLTNLRYAGLLHDVGKVAIDQSVLHKRTPLTKNETKELEKHPIIGQKIVSSVRFLKSTALIIRHHHERWDGMGYPDGKKRKSISLEARILAVTDSYDAMVTRRSYGNKMNRAEAIRELEAGSGKQFDPKLIKIFVELLRLGKIRIPSPKFMKQ